MAINLGGAVPGINRMSSLGSPMNRGGMCFAEDADGLPPGWHGLNEERGFRKDESVVMVMGTEGGMDAAQFSPGGYRAFQKSGHGGIARRLGVKGKPGPHNFLDFILPGIWAGGRKAPGPSSWSTRWPSTCTNSASSPRPRSTSTSGRRGSSRSASTASVPGWTSTTNGWTGIDRQSGKPWKELPDDHMISVAGDQPSDNCIIVCGVRRRGLHADHRRRRYRGAAFRLSTALMRGADVEEQRYLHFAASTWVGSMPVVSAG